MTDMELLTRRRPPARTTCFSEDAFAQCDESCAWSLAELLLNANRRLAPGAPQVLRVDGVEIVLTTQRTGQPWRIVSAAHLDSQQIELR